MAWTGKGNGMLLYGNRHTGLPAFGLAGTYEDEMAIYERDITAWYDEMAQLSMDVNSGKIVPPEYDLRKYELEKRKPVEPKKPSSSSTSNADTIAAITAAGGVAAGAAANMYLANLAYKAQLNQMRSGTDTGAGLQTSSPYMTSGVMGAVKNYWWLAIPVAAIGLLFLLKK